jgi:hypothetical protein
MPPQRYWRDTCSTGVDTTSNAPCVTSTCQRHEKLGTSLPVPSFCDSIWLRGRRVPRAARATCSVYERSRSARSRDRRITRAIRIARTI